jgi:uncharacterized paraquat-inducible protein A
MIKLGAALVVAIVSFVMWQVRQSQARARLREIDEGKRCVACDGTNLMRANDHARCLRCGHTVSLASLRAAVVSSGEIANVTRPPDA